MEARCHSVSPSTALKQENDDARAPAFGGRAPRFCADRLVHRLMQSLPDIPVANRRKATDDLSRPSRQ